METPTICPTAAGEVPLLNVIYMNEKKGIEVNHDILLTHVPVCINPSKDNILNITVNTKQKII